MLCHSCGHYVLYDETVNCPVTKLTSKTFFLFVCFNLKGTIMHCELLDFFLFIYFFTSSTFCCKHCTFTQIEFWIQGLYLVTAFFTLWYCNLSKTFQLLPQLLTVLCFIVCCIKFPSSTASLGLFTQPLTEHGSLWYSSFSVRSKMCSGHYTIAIQCEVNLSALGNTWTH